MEHYLEYGAAERRAAGPRFDTQAYLAANPDVAASAVHPLVHYIRHGRQEGRGFAQHASSALDQGAVRQPETKPVTFSLILTDGEKSDLHSTLKSIANLSGIFLEIIHSNKFGADDIRRVDHSDRRFVRFVEVDEKNGQGFLRDAVLTATSEFLIVIDPGDVLLEELFWKLSSFINRHICDVVYTDEDQGPAGSTEIQVSLKPAWSPELLTSFNYFGRTTAIRRSVAVAALIDANGKLPALAAEAAEWDLNLRVSERTQAIEHLPEVLCRRPRSGRGDRRLDVSTAESIVLLKDYWRRRGHEAEVSRAMDGMFRSTWPLARRPLVSIIIPNKDRVHLLRTCADGLYNKTDYPNFELIIVDNGSTDPETLKLYEELRKKSARIADYDERFNYSRACNMGAAAARGEMLLFLNNDIEVVQPNWLDELVRQASEPGVGVVGPKLLYPDGEIQHAGVALGLFVLAAHVFHRAPQDDWGPFGSPDTQRNWLAVTGACQLVRRSLFDLVQGYDEAFEISYSDVMFCIDVVRMGFRSVYLPASVLVHHEGASRGHTNPTSDQILFAKRIRSAGLSVDPYFHPCLETASFAPKYRKAGERTGLSPMQDDIERLAGPPGRPLDPYDLGAVASASGMAWSAVVWPFKPAHMKPSLEAGRRIVLEFLWRRSDLRRRFPRAIRDGAQGGFASWVRTEGLALLGLGSDHAPWINAAFDANHGAAARQILVYDKTFRAEQPLFLLPEGRAASCARLFDAVREGRIGCEDIWWFLFANAEASQAALCDTWAITPSWQSAVPDGGTIFGVARLAQWVSDLYGVRDAGIYAQDDPTVMSDAAQVRHAYAARPKWQALFPDAMTDEMDARALLDHLTTRASGLSFLARGWVEIRRSGTLARDVVRPGVNMLAHFAYPSGLRISSENLVAGLQANGMEVSLRDVPVGLASDEPVGDRFRGFEIYDTTLIHVQPEPLFGSVYEQSGLLAREDRTYRIGYWYWEFDEVPESWNWASLQCDELWTATEFIADGLRRRYRQPVHVLPPGIEISSFERTPRSGFGFGDDAFVFLFVFHMTSVLDRKNPLGLIKAFKQAFPKREGAKLVIKTTFGYRHPAVFAALMEAAEGAEIEIIDAVYIRDETLSLIEACDAYVSLHRSEGLGLPMAEAMLLGKPVIATGYSGNLDFMDANNSLLVDHRVVTLARDIPPYKAGQRWAEPSIPHAARHMRTLFEQRDLARTLGARAGGPVATAELPLHRQGRRHAPVRDREDRVALRSRPGFAVRTPLPWITRRGGASLERQALPGRVDGRCGSAGSRDEQRCRMPPARGLAGGVMGAVFPAVDEPEHEDFQVDRCRKSRIATSRPTPTPTPSPDQVGPSPATRLIRSPCRFTAHSR